MNKRIYLIALVGTLLASQSCTNNVEMKEKAIDPANLDLTVNPGDDFNQYANGGWMRNNPIPADKSRYGSFDELSDKNEVQVKNLLDKIAANSYEQGTVEQKIADFLKTGMDTLKIEEQGIKELTSEFEKIASITKKEEVEKQILHFQKNGIKTAFAIYSSADAKNSQIEVTHLHQSGLGMPDRDYYLSNEDRFVKIREKYTQYIEKMFSLLGDDEAKAKTNAEEVLHLETQFAIASMDRLSMRDPHKTYNKLTLSNLIELSPNFDWKNYFTELKLNDPGTIIISHPDFIATFDKILNTENIEKWKTYFRWHLINSTASYLSKEFVNASFDFYGKTMQGTPVNRPRWKRVNAVANNYLSEAIGQVYVKEYFPPEAKERMLKLVDNLKLALGERIAGLAWMEDETKKNAQEKLDAITVKIGYPNKWKDYEKLEIKNDAYVLNVLRSRVFYFEDMLAKINQAVDKTEWHMPPQMVNAYYNPSQNEIVFPAGILQPPFFYLNADDAVNYGAIGVVIGHEMTHGFDDKGRLYDKVGNLNTWWTEKDNEQFIEKANVLVEQFDNFIVIDSIKANGKYTLGENIADLGGINISYTAFKKTEEWKHQDKKIDGFTPDQRFFLAYAHIWGQNIRDKEILRRTQEDVHSLGKYRVIGPLRNVSEFHNAFDIKEGDYMFLPENERAIIW